MASSHSQSSSSSLLTRRWTYDVFLSFRGDDTRYNFVDHLYAALIQQGIRAFKDDKTLRRGQPISSELLKSIEESRIAVVVFSKNYAESSWCLDELCKIMECQDRVGQRVLPVFYHVDPSDVRKLKRKFAVAFQQHDDKSRGEMWKVNKWREALIAASKISGWPISKTRKEGESTIISKIVREILGSIKPCAIENNLVGIMSHIDELYSLLGMEARDEVRMVGILGMGGIGKTTIAQALFRRIAPTFEGSSFIKGVRRNKNRDICELQQKILRDVIGTHHVSMINDPEVGAEMIRIRLCNKKVLLVLDDVDDVKQLDFLAATHEWFGSGSRIIITTRDDHLLSHTDAKYKPPLLLMDQAVELFSMHAFRKDSPPAGYKKLADRAIRCAGRLPLALTVLGCFFRGRQANVWESALDRLAKTPNSEIFGALKLSFDGLEDSEKTIFLDIACFFKNRQVKDVSRVLDSCGLYSGIGISALIGKCLITVSNGKLDMHDLLQEMGWQIVRVSSPNSRLWQLEQIHDSIKRNRKLELIEAIVVPSKQYNVDLSFSADVYESMQNLRLLHVYRKFTSSAPTFLPDELRSLRWDDYPFLSLPVAQMDKLVELEIRRGQIQHLWKGQKFMPNLKYIHLQWLDCISRFPDVSGAPNIERLILSSCEYLFEVHESLGSLKKLIYLDMSNCGRLKRLPSRIKMESLETLNISYTGLERFPEFSSCMVKLSHIKSQSCYRIKELPSSVRYLSNLSVLNLRSCINLEDIPNSIYKLKHLKSLFLEDCPKLQKLPEDFGRLENLQELELGVQDEFVISVGLPKFINLHAITNLYSLRKLDLNLTQIEDKDFPKSLHGLSSLEKLNLSGNLNLTQLPVRISHLSLLKHLELNNCPQLQSLRGLPLGIQVLKASYCSSLKNIEDFSKEHEFLSKIWFLDCHKLLRGEESKRYFDKMLKQTFFKKFAAVDGALSVTFPGSKIPGWFKEQQNGQQIALKLPPKWQTRLMGFILCGVFRQRELYASNSIEFRFENDAVFVHKFDNHHINASTAAGDGNVWLGYIPFSSFQQDDGFQRGDVFHMIEGNLFIAVELNHYETVRCGAQIVYKEDVKQIQPCISYCWKWELTQINHTVTHSCQRAT